jgi:hypothetical protein
MFFLNSLESIISFFCGGVSKRIERKRQQLLKYTSSNGWKKIKNCKGSNFYASIMLRGSISFPACKSNLVWIASWASGVDICLELFVFTWETNSYAPPLAPPVVPPSIILLYTSTFGQQLDHWTHFVDLLSPRSKDISAPRSWDRPGRSHLVDYVGSGFNI